MRMHVKPSNYNSSENETMLDEYANETKTEFVNIANLFKEKEYKDTLLKMKELVKVSDMVDMPIIITGYKEDKMADNYSGGEKDCFRMDFYFAEDETKTKHYIRTEATYLWQYLKTVNMVNPELLSSGTVVTIICKGEKRNGKNKTPFYYFAGTVEE